MNVRTQRHSVDDVSLAIRQEIHRFESVHPSLYALYELTDALKNFAVPVQFQQELRTHIVCIEDAFVNSQEWTVSRRLRDIRLGVLGSQGSGKCALVHRYLTGTYLSEESPEGGRFKKEVAVDGQSYLLLIRDEAGKPDIEFAHWMDAVLLVFSLDSELSFSDVYSNYACLCRFRDMREIPIVIVGTQDAISERSPRAVDDARVHRLAAELHNCTFHETCAMYGLNIDRVFQDACQKIVKPKLKPVAAAPVPFVRQLSIPVTRAHAYQMQFSQNKTAHINGDVDHSPKSTTSLAPASSVALIPQRAHVSPEVNERSNRSVNTRQGVVQQDSGDTESTGTEDSLQNLPLKATSVVPDVVAKKSASLPENAMHHVQQNAGQMNGSKTSFGPILTPVLSRRQKFGKNVQKSNSFNGLAVIHRASLPPSQGVLPEVPSPTLTPVLARKKHGSKSYHDHLTPAADRNLSINATPNLMRKNRRPNFFSRKNDDDKKNRADDTRLSQCRQIPVKQGFLYKKSGKPLSREWKKKYVTLMDDGHLIYYPSYNDYMDDIHSKEITLIRTTVKLPGGRPRGCEISKSASSTPAVNGLLVPGSGDPPSLPLLQVGVSPATHVPLKSTETPAVKKKHRRSRSGARSHDVIADADYDDLEFSIVSLDGRQWMFEAATLEERDEWTSAIQEQIRSILLQNDSNKSRGETNNASAVAVAAAIRSVSGNSVCADCCAVNPDWASINLGIVLCIECSGIHRNLGTHVSRIRSLDLDDWPRELVLVMNAVGNDISNAVYEADTNVQTKPLPSASRDEKDKWIRAKYEFREFLPPLPYGDISLSQQLIDAVARQDVNKTILVISHFSSADRQLVSAPFNQTDWRTALHIAAFLGNVVILQLLLWNGADSRALDHEGHDPLYYAKASIAAEAALCTHLLQTSQNCRDSLIT